MESKKKYEKNYKCGGKILCGRARILIKEVAQAIPSYTVSIFRLPQTLCNKLRSMIVRFWWGGSEEANASIGGSAISFVGRNTKFKRYS